MPPDLPTTDDAALKRLSCFLQILEACGHQCSKSTTLLDFGCGSGYLVSVALKLGIDAYGCDVEFEHSTYNQDLLTDLRSIDRVRQIETKASMETRRVFGLSPGCSDPYRLPFEDCSIDMVISDQVLEHVDNYSEVARELHRVMKPGAGFLHLFPSRFGLIERHTNIPLAGAFHPDWWVKLFAYAGVRIWHHDGLSAPETFRWTSDYLANHVNYLSQAELIDVFSGLFAVSFVEREWLKINPNARLFLHPYLYRIFHSRCLYGVRL
jgi:SAM-dependent methyltransferase